MKKKYAAAGLALIGAVLLFAVFSFLRENWSASGAPGGVERWVARWILFRNRGADTDVLNPLPQNAETLAAGRVIYEKHCAFCHGADGKGPGPNGMKFYPPVSSLAPTTAPLTDGQTFSIIDLGIRYTAMPGFGEALPDEDIWKVSRYLHRLSAQSLSVGDAGSPISH